MQGIGSFDGIASGLDTTQLVDAIITAERANARLLEARQQEKTNALTTYSSLEALLIAFRSEATRLARSSTFDVSAFTVSDNTVLDASAPGLVASATYDIEVRRLAQAHQIASQGYGSMSAVVGTGDFSIQVGHSSAVTVTLDADTNTLSDLRDAINASEADVTAAVINDGSADNSYRLVLTGKNTGLANRLVVQSDLTGGDGPDYLTSRFDTPETLITDALTTSALTLGATAAYSGSENKTYTFTVQGAGTQTVGIGEISVEWSDGVHSGTILVNQADTEIALAGDGADGLKISFGAGELHGGDVFQVQSFAPQLQAAQDAEIAVGTSGNGASPLILRGETNDLSGSLPGINLRLKKTTAPGDKVTVTAGPAVENIKGQIKGFVEKYNAVMTAVDKQFSYNQATGESGTLIGDSSLLFIQSRLRTRIGGVVDGLSGDIRTLSTLGIRTGAKGLLKVDESRLDEKINSNWEGVRKLFSRSGVSTKKGITFISAGSDTRATESGYDVDITQVATHGYYQGKAITDPATTPLVLTPGQNTLILSVDGLTSDTLTLSAKTYTTGSELAAELQTRIDHDDHVSGRGITVEWVEGSGSGHLQITSGSYGASSVVGVSGDLSGSAADLLGLSGATSVNGLNVEGTINGETAKGVGQLLTGEDDNSTTAGLVLRVELIADDLGPGAEGQVSYVRGLAASLDAELEALTDAQEGFLSARRKGLEAQIQDLKLQIERFDERLLIRRNALLKKFQAMEDALGQFQSQSTFLAGAIDAISSNFRTIMDNSRSQ